MDSKGIYVVAVRRERRADAPANWQEILRRFEGIEVISPSSAFQRLTVKATIDSIDRLRNQMGRFLLIEPVVEHRLLATE